MASACLSTLGLDLGPQVVTPTCLPLTCSCSSASRVARSSSESELELEESALLSLLPVLLLTTAVADTALGEDGSAGSSGILANFISNTSCRSRTNMIGEIRQHIISYNGSFFFFQQPHLEFPCHGNDLVIRRVVFVTI